VAKTTERLFHRIIDRCLPAGTIGHDACHAMDQEEIARLKSLLRQYELVMTQEDHEIVRDVQRLERTVDRLTAFLREVMDSVEDCPRCGAHLLADGHWGGAHAPTCEIDQVLGATR
jgi:hypothetical protein